MTDYDFTKYLPSTLKDKYLDNKIRNNPSINILEKTLILISDIVNGKNSSITDYKFRLEELKNSWNPYGLVDIDKLISTLDANDIIPKISKIDDICGHIETDVRQRAYLLMVQPLNKMKGTLEGLKKVLSLFGIALTVTPWYYRDFKIDAPPCSIIVTAALSSGCLSSETYPLIEEIVELLVDICANVVHLSLIRKFETYLTNYYDIFNILKIHRYFCDSWDWRESKQDCNLLGIANKPRNIWFRGPSLKCYHTFKSNGIYITNCGIDRKDCDLERVDLAIPDPEIKAGENQVIESYENPIRQWIFEPDIFIPAAGNGKWVLKDSLDTYEYEEGDTWFAGQLLGNYLKAGDYRECVSVLDYGKATEYFYALNPLDISMLGFYTYRNPKTDVHFPIIRVRDSENNIFDIVDVKKDTYTYHKIYDDLGYDAENKDLYVVCWYDQSGNLEEKLNYVNLNEWIPHNSNIIDFNTFFSVEGGILKEVFEKDKYYRILFDFKNDSFVNLEFYNVDPELNTLNKVYEGDSGEFTVKAEETNLYIKTNGETTILELFIYEIKGNHFIQENTSKQPKFVFNYDELGYPAVIFDGIDDNLKCVNLLNLDDSIGIFIRMSIEEDLGFISQYIIEKESSFELVYNYIEDSVSSTEQLSFVVTNDSGSKVKTYSDIFTEKFYNFLVYGDDESTKFYINKDKIHETNDIDNIGFNLNYPYMGNNSEETNPSKVAITSYLIFNRKFDIDILNAIMEYFMGVPLSRYVKEFEASDWNDYGSSYYSISIPNSEHKRGLSPIVYVMEEDSGIYKEVSLHNIEVNDMGEVKLIIVNDPDTRFTGKAVLI